MTYEVKAAQLKDNTWVVVITDGDTTKLELTVNTMHQAVAISRNMMVSGEIHVSGDEMSLGGSKKTKPIDSNYYESLPTVEVKYRLNGKFK